MARYPKYTVSYQYWNPAGGRTNGLRNIETKKELLEYLDLLTEDETIIDFLVAIDNPMPT